MMLFQDITVFLTYTAVRHGTFTSWLQIAAAISSLLILVPILSLTVMLLRVFYASRRKLISLSDEPQQILGKPLLFPVKLNHTRLTPVKNQFANRFMMVGIPVGLSCRVGNLLSVDDKRLTLENSSVQGAPWARILSQLSCWFTVDSERFLHRGDTHLGLREKLDVFLKQQNEDPAQWPYAYLLGVPRFLWWSRAVVSWWYLYSPDRELDAVIMEINNSYDEKRNVFFRVTRSSEKDIALTDDKQNGLTEKVNEEEKEARYLDDRRLIRHLSSQPQSTFYKGVWEKFVFASPFEKVDGSISNRFIDLAYDGTKSWKQNVSMLNTNTLSPTGKVKMITRMTCCGSPLDPSQMTFAQLARVVFQWTLPGVLTTPSIVLEALRIRYRGLQKIMSKTPVRSGSVGRHASWVERNLEPFFRDYLASCISRYPRAVELTYLPCRSFSNDSIQMRSPSYLPNQNAGVLSLTIEPLDPSFYTRIVNYPTIQEGIEHELRVTGQEADVISRHLAVSDPALLQDLLKESARYKRPEESSRYASNSSFSIIPFLQPVLLSCLRGNLSPTFMDEYVAAVLPLSSRAVYVALVVQHFLIQRLAFGSHLLFWMYGVVATTAIKLAILRVTGDIFESRVFAASNPIAFLEGLAGWVVCFVLVSSVFDSIREQLTLVDCDFEYKSKTKE